MALQDRERKRIKPLIGEADMMTNAPEPGSASHRPTASSPPSLPSFSARRTSRRAGATSPDKQQILHRRAHRRHSKRPRRRRSEDHSPGGGAGVDRRVENFQANALAPESLD